MRRALSSKLSKKKPSPTTSDGSSISPESDHPLSPRSVSPTATPTTPSAAPLTITCLDDLPEQLVTALREKTTIPLWKYEENLLVLLDVLRTTHRLTFDVALPAWHPALHDGAPPPAGTSLIQPDANDTAILLDRGRDEACLVDGGEAELRACFSSLVELGSGGFGTVFEGKWKKGKVKGKVAVKIATGAATKELLREVGVLATVAADASPHIVAMRGFLVAREGAAAALVMDLLQGGSIEQAAKKRTFDDRHVAYAAHCLLLALQTLHGHGIMHRDLKSANCMLDVDGGVRLIDMGLAVAAPTSTTVCGSPFWMAPEMIRRQVHDARVDSYSLSVSLIEMSCGEPPNRSSRVAALFLAGSNQLTLPTNASEHFAAFLRKGLAYNVSDRATVSELLQDPFIQTVGGDLSAGKAAISPLLRDIFLQDALQAIF